MLSCEKVLDMENAAPSNALKMSVATADDLAWAAQRLALKAWPSETKGLAIRAGDTLRAVTAYNHFYDGKTCSIHIATDGSRQWATRGMLYGIFAYPFEQCGLRRVTAPISSANKASLILVVKLGFQFEGRLLNACKDGDQVIMGMLREDCSWIKKETAP